jgi:hypothetical protein
LPGELYTNWPDGQLGVINSTGNPQDLIAVRFFSSAANYNVGDFVINSGRLYSAATTVTPGAFNSGQWTPVAGSVSVGDTFPANPQPGSLWWDSVGGQLYVYFNDGDTTQWVIANNFNGGAYLPLNGGTLSGALALNADPTVALGAATKQYVDNSEATLWQNIRYRNRVINGDMSVDQRNGGNVIAIPANANLYAIDRWKCASSVAASIGSAGQALGTPSLALSYASVLSWNTVTAHTPAAGEYLQIYQFIDGYNFNDAGWGAAGAQPITLEFWANATVAGTYGGYVGNGGARAYTFPFTLAANVWTKFRINIPGDTAGTWQVAGNAGAFVLGFSICAGSTLRTAPNIWTAGSFIAPTGAVNITTTAGASFFITGVALMVGAAAANAEPEFRKYSDNLLDCQRYFVRAGLTQAVSVGQSPVNWPLFTNYTAAPVQMRTTPTLAANWAAGNNIVGDAISMMGDARTVQGAYHVPVAGGGTINLVVTLLDADF